MCAYLYQS
uniref:Uncharacterized protein n=1 Tax=Arundo donax TaxID=35708 RepID=A0A0A8ZK52_ARUDO